MASPGEAHGGGGSRIVLLSIGVALAGALWFPLLLNLPTAVERWLDRVSPHSSALPMLDGTVLILASFLLPVAGIALGALAAWRRRRRAGLAIAFGAAVVLWNAFLLPSLLRACCVANEAAAIGELRTVVSAEAAYQSENAGLYGTLDCLAAPAGCIAGYPASAPTFLDPSLLAGERRGYRFRFHPGLAATVRTDAEGASRGGLRTGVGAYALTAVPVKPGETGVRGFCADASGRICETPDGSEPPTAGGACPADCTSVR